MVTKKIYLGPLELRLLLALEARGAKLFTIEDAKAILAVSDTFARKLLHGLVKKGRLTRVERGKYVLSPAKSGIEGLWVEHPFLIVPHLAKEYYVGFWTALNYWGMTEQVPRVVYVAIPRPHRKTDVEYGGYRLQFVHMAARKFFGYGEEMVEGHPFKVSSPRKTLLDCLAHPEYCGGVAEVAKALWQKKYQLSWHGIGADLDRYGVDAVRRRLGYLLELLGQERGLSNALAKKTSVGYRWLDPGARKEVLEYSKRWGLMVNVPKETLLAFRSF